MPADFSDDDWVETCLFYVTVPRLPDDPDTVRKRAEVLYGEGATVPAAETPRMRTEKLGDGLWLLRVTSRVRDLADILGRETFDHRGERFTFGLVRRPPTAGLAMPQPSSVLDAPVDGAYRFVQFIRVDKLALLQRVSITQIADPPARGLVDRLLNALATFTSCELRGDHIQWLGDVIIAERFKSPVSWHPVASANGAAPRALDAHLLQPIGTMVHAQVRITGTDGMCICDRILQWRPGETATQRIATSEDFGGVFTRVWVDSELILEEQRVILRGFMTTLELGGASWTIQDRLTRKLAAAVHGGAAKAQLLAATQRGQSTALSTKVGSQLPPEAWTGLNRTPQIVFDYIRPRPPDYGYFPKGAGGRAEAVLHFAELVSKAEQAYLVDPWFDATGAEALLPRVRGDVRFTVVTNLPSFQHSEHLMALDTFLLSASVMGLPENLQVLCVTGSRPDAQVFHDRFLLLRKQGEEWRGFVLTNSFSGLATEYSLFVVAADQGTTALLLAELEQLLDSCNGRLKRIWPPEQGRSISSRLDDHGEFPYWRTFLRVLVRRWPGTDRPWLLAAQTGGFVLLREDGMKWLMRPEARVIALRFLLGPRAGGQPKHRRRLGLRAVQHAPSHHRREARLPIGRAVLVLGELAARGLDVDAHFAASCLGLKDGKGIARALRATFNDDSDPIVLRPGGSETRMRIRQGLRDDMSLSQAAWTGLSHWIEGVFPRSRTSYWDRSFAYAVLAYLDPGCAVRLCEELLDADLVLALFGPQHRRCGVWSEPLANALIRSCSPVLRAAGAQSLSHSSFDGRGHDAAPSQADVLGTLVEIRAASWADEEIAYLLGVWGIEGEDRKRTDTASELVQVLGALDNDALGRFANFLFRDEVRAFSFMERLVATLLLLSEEWSTRVLEALVQKFAERFHLPRGDFYFAETVHVPLTAVIARAAVGLATRRGTTPTVEIHRAARITELEGEFDRITPFRWRADAGTADAAIGWTVLWDLIASTSRTEEGDAMAPEDIVQRAVAYLQSPALRQSAEIRGCVRRVLGPAVLSVPPHKDDA